MSLYCQLLENSLGVIKIWKQTHVKRGIKLESHGAIKIQTNIR